MSHGADTDYFGLADTNVKLQSSSKTPAYSEGQAIDSNGDINASTIYDSAMVEYSSTYRMASDTALVLFDTTTAVDHRLGKVASNIVLTTIDVGTSPDNRPEITMSGQACATADSLVEKYDPSDLEISGARKATPIGMSADTNSKVTGASASASVEIGRILDSLGAIANVDVWGGRIEATNDFVGVGDNPGAAADTGWTLLTPVSIDQANEEYGTGSGTVFKNITRDT